METNTSNTESQNYVYVSTYGEASQWTYVLSVVFMSAVTAVGVPGNGLVLIIQTRIRTKSSTDHYVLLMALFDFIGAGVNAPIFVLRNITSVWNNIASLALCRIHYFVLYATFISSTLLVSLLAFERRTLTCQQFPTSRLRVGRARKACVFVIILSLVVATCTLFMSAINTENGECAMDSDLVLINTTFLSAMALAFCVMFIVTIACYIKIFIVLRIQHQKNVQRQLDSLHGTTEAQLPALDLVDSQVPSAPGNDCSATSRTPTHTDTTVSHQDTGNHLGSDMGGVAASYIAPKSLQPGRGRSKQKQLSNVRRPNRVVPQNGDCNRTVDRPGIFYIGVRSGQSENITKTVVVKRPERHSIHRMTAIMFIITATYICSWLLNWSIILIYQANTQVAIDVAHIFKTIYMINTAVNPLVYISMSSRFRKHTRQLFARRWPATLVQ